MDEGQSHFCYILKNNVNSVTYVGYTNNPERRLRQHNGELVGGARTTGIQRKKCGERLRWEFAALVTHPGLTHWRALSLEWHIKHETRKIKGMKKGVEKRMAALKAAMVLPKFSDLEEGGWVLNHCLVLEQEVATGVYL